jgi:hypothetical protein
MYCFGYLFHLGKDVEIVSFGLSRYFTLSVSAQLHAEYLCALYHRFSQFFWYDLKRVTRLHGQCRNKQCFVDSNRRNVHVY